MRAAVDTARREDWNLYQVARGFDVLTTNPEVVKTGLHLLYFPSIVFCKQATTSTPCSSWRAGLGESARADGTCAPL